jgi:hypothetical protein
VVGSDPAPISGVACGRGWRLAAGPGRCLAPDTRVRTAERAAILSAMTTQMPRIPARPTLDGLEDKWTQRWAKERVVQV